jgi:hypothetical protein
MTSTAAGERVQGCRILRAAWVVPRADRSCQRNTPYRLVKKVDFATDSYQGMTLVMPYGVENRTRALPLR